MAVDNEKEVATGIISLPDSQEDVSSSDGDDALKLAGTHAHNFDEKYYARLRRKIVCCLELKQSQPIAQLTSSL